MRVALLLVVLAAPAWGTDNYTLEEVLVSSQPLRVSAEDKGAQAKVRPLSRRIGRSVEDEGVLEPGVIFPGTNNKAVKHRDKREEDVTHQDPTSQGRAVKSEEVLKKRAVQSETNTIAITTQNDKDEQPKVQNELRAAENNGPLEASAIPLETNTAASPQEGRGHKKKLQKTFEMIKPYLMVPGMMALGYAPIILSSLKMFVMNALMINVMAFNAAIFITLRNMVFGPRNGQHVKYYNFGYSNHRKKPHHHHSHHHPSHHHPSHHHSSDHD